MPLEIVYTDLTQFYDTYKIIGSIIVGGRHLPNRNDKESCVSSFVTFSQLTTTNHDYCTPGTMLLHHLIWRDFKMAFLPLPSCSFMSTSWSEPTNLTTLVEGILQIAVWTFCGRRMAADGRILQKGACHILELDLASFSNSPRRQFEGEKWLRTEALRFSGKNSDSERKICEMERRLIMTIHPLY
jgi:hypothetical protein